MRILAVQNDANVLELLVQLLIDRPDYDAVAARTTDAARKLLADPAVPSFDCALIDGDIDRGQTLKFVSDLRKRSDMPVLITSIDTDKAALKALFAIGATDVAAKPFEITGLRGRIALLAHALPAGFADVTAPVARQDPLRIIDADSFISAVAFENYSKQLIRYRYGGSCVFGLAINDIAALHHKLSPFAFHCMINDLAAMIDTEAQKAGYLVTYAGDGIFLGMTDLDGRSDTGVLVKAINRALVSDGIYDDQDRPLHVYMSGGHALRLDVGHSAAQTLSEARQSVEKARQAAEGYVAPYVLMDRIA